MTRFLVLFAREPAREARAKGLSGSGGEGLFGGFAAGWLDAAARAKARLVVAAPAEDLAAWRRRLPDGADIAWIAQRGRSIGERLRRAAAHESLAEGRSLVVGGDVVPDPDAVRHGFEALESGAEAVLVPAPDGGVSLIALSPDDHDLFARVSVGSRSVFRDLFGSLASRRRRVAVLSAAPDVDGPRCLRRMLRGREVISRITASLMRAALARTVFDFPSLLRSPRERRRCGPTGLRAPPLAA